ncbi:MAG: glycoside hydrolase family 27 protein [Ferruginibacter sp.]
MNYNKSILLLFFVFFSCISIFAQTNKEKDFHSWAPTPPMGWNSWDCYGPNVTEAEVKANADYMAANLKQYGWNYIVIDIRWYVANDKSHGYNETDPQYNIDSFGRFIPAVNRFPSAANGKGFKPLADYLHSKGLKMGIHIMRGVPVIAVKNKMRVYGTNKTAANIYSDSIQCKWLHDMYTVVATKGAQEYYNSIINLYADWGVDFIKCDDLSRPYHKAEIEMLRKAIDNCGRKIVLSTSPGETPITEGKHVQNHANMWRTIDDFWDNWPELKAHFDIFARWNQYRVSGAYPDGDMLPLGHLGIKAERGIDRMSLLTKDEQYTLMTLWCIFKSPLIFGGDLPTSDSFTMSLLTNREVLYVLNRSTNNRQLINAGNKIAWTADDPGNSDKYLAMFNAADTAQTVSISMIRYLGVKGNYSIKNIWTGKQERSSPDMVSAHINPHGVVFYKLSKQK